MPKVQPHNALLKEPNRGFLGDGSTLNQEEWDTRERLRRMIDLGNFNLRVWAVAASGFFTDSYNLFSTNVILPSLAFVYWTEDVSTWRETVINAMTLLGSIVGMILFGYLADKYGRTRLYGVELVIVIFSTIGVASCSTGFKDMNVLGWISVWRFVMGVGIGAEYPLSAVITAEWSATRARGRMLGAVFLMQPLGQIISQIVGLAVLYGRNQTHNLQGVCPNSLVNMNVSPNSTTVDIEKCKIAVDSIWRIVVGVGAAPAVIAIVFRFLIWDSGLYDLEVKRQGPRALVNTARIYGNYDESNGNHATDAVHNHVDTVEEPIQFSLTDLRRFFIEEQNYKYLMGTSLCWFLLDFAFYGLGMGNPRTLAKIFAGSDAPNAKKLPSWNTDAWNPQYTIYDVLKQTAFQSIWVVSISSLIGSVLFIFVVDRIPRRRWLIWSFSVLCVLFVLTGATFPAFFKRDGRYVTILLVALCHFAFNFGANTLTFIIPAEVFPTTYRAFCHGISAAAGKLGSIIVLVILHSVQASDPHTDKQLPIFISFGAIMALGAIAAWIYIPNTQQREGPEDGYRWRNTTLEELGRGKMGAYDGLPIGLRERIRSRREG